MTPVSAFFGDKNTFAIGCRVEFETETPSRNEAGTLRFWIGGSEVGNPDVVSLPGIVVNELRQTLTWCGKRFEAGLYSADVATVLDSVQQGLYGSPTSDSGERWERFLICMLPGGNEYMDGWLIVLIEGPSDSMKDRVLYRAVQLGQDREAWIPHGTYRKAAAEFINWFEKALHRRGSAD